MQQSVTSCSVCLILEPRMIEREILIPKEHKEVLLQELDLRWGISEKTLFSDLAGFFERRYCRLTRSLQQGPTRDGVTTREEIRKAEAQVRSNKEALRASNYFQIGPMVRICIR